ncbi:toprim domain-containing protein [Patescibacteria group bacterium]|nr:toprim domain-containing protein [Patescibacteria group bacterium]
MAGSDVEKIKARLNIVDVVGQYVPLKKAGRNYTARCPFHKERTPSFFVSPERGTYMCFGCGEKGDVFSFVQKIEGSDFPTALAQLAEKAGVTLEHRAPKRPEDKQKEEHLREVCEEAVKFFEANLKGRKDVREYLHHRGVEPTTEATWRLGYAPAAWEELSKHLLAKGFSKDHIVEAGFAVRSEKKPGEIFDRFRGRIIFPIMDTGGRVVAVSGRIFEEMPPKTSGKAGSSADSSRGELSSAKYVNSPETLLFKKSRILYGFDRAKQAIRKADCILLVEGQFDLILSHQSGLPFAVALSGTALTQEHLSLLGRFSKRLVLALDADQAGLRSGLKSTLMALKDGFEVKVATFPEGKDPADLAGQNPELLKAAIRTSKTAVEFFLDTLQAGARDNRAYERLIEAQVLPLVAALKSRIEQAHFISLVAARLKVPEEAVMAEVAKRPALTEPAEDSPQGAPAMPELSAFERAVGMLLYHFSGGEKDGPMHKRLIELVGAERILALEEKLLSHAEALRFAFDSECDASENEVKVVGDLLRRVEEHIVGEELSQAGEDTKKITELARRQQELRK